MKKKLRILSFVLCVAMLVCLIAGCGNGGSETSAPAENQTASNQNTETNTPEETETPQTEEPTEEPTEETEVPAVSLPLTTEEEVFSYFISYPPIITNYIDEPFIDYPAWVELQERTGVTIDWRVVSVVAETESFNIMINSGDYTDIMSSTLFPNSLDFYVEEEVILDIKKLAQENMPNYLAAIDKYEELGKAIGIESDKGYWAVIHNYVKDAEINSGQVIRKDWLEDLNLDMPETYEDYYNVLTAFKTEKGADAALWLNYTGVPADDMLVSGYGINAYSNQAGMITHPYYQVDGEVGYGPYSDAYYDYLEMMAKWYAEGLIYKDFISYKESNVNPPTDLVTNGRTGMWTSQKTNMHQMEIQSGDTSMKISAVSDAVKNDGDRSHLLKSTDAVTIGGTSIAATCHNPALLLQFFDYCYSDEGSLLMNYGVEGLSFEYVDGEPQLTELVTNPQEIPAMSLAIAVYTGGNTFAGVIETSRMRVAYSDAQLEAEDIWRKNADGDNLIPSLVAMNEEEAEVYNAKMGDISTRVSEYTVAVITGAEPLTPESFAAYKENLKEMGIEDCIASKQSAMTRYLEKIS